MYSITAALLLSSPCVANRIQRDAAEAAGSLDTSVDTSEPLQTKDSSGGAVDWHFMTPTLSWAGRGDQEKNDVVGNHACQSLGRYDESYYATSLCYWHPETHAGNQRTGRYGLQWRGGYGPREFCGRLQFQSGVCARCSVCHDNSRDRDAQVDSSAGDRLEIIPLPDCMKEVAIEADCNHQFEAENPELVAHESQCRAAQRDYAESVTNFNTVNTTIMSSEASISQLMHNLAHGHPQGAHCGASTIQDMRQTVVSTCRRFGVRDRHDNAQMMNLMPRCQMPGSFVKLADGALCEPGTEIMDPQECTRAVTALGVNGDIPNLGIGDISRGRPSGCSMQTRGSTMLNGRAREYVRFNRDPNGRARTSYSPVCRVAMPDNGSTNATHRRCERCTGHMDTLQTAMQESQSAQVELEGWQTRIGEHRQNIGNHMGILAQSYQDLPGRLVRKAQMEEMWLPIQQGCQQVYEMATERRNSNLMACAPRFYDQSCEKACVEIQRTGDHGCGVVEGSQYGDAFQRGGIEVSCSPPAHSWIMSTAGFSEAEQCERINAEQSSRMTTPAQMSDFLTIPSDGGWFSRDERMYYVLESGNDVRSATLRKFDAALPDGSEQSDDGVILWDAEEVSATETNRERACFEIKHRYDGRTSSWERRGTTTTYCITRADGGSSRRDAWVSALQRSMVWRPRVA